MPKHLLLFLLFVISYSTLCSAQTMQAQGLTSEQKVALRAIAVTPEEVKSVESMIASFLPSMNAIAETRVIKAKGTYDPPVVEYYGSPGTPSPSCFEPLPIENAVYCPATNHLFLDTYWFVQLTKYLKGEIDKYAILAILGHEFGHAADYKFNRLVREGVGSLAWGLLHEVVSESSADCFAGAAMASLLRDSSQEEQSNALQSGMDMIYAIQGDDSDRAYPPGSERMKTFKSGFNQGIDTCYKH